MSLEIKPLSDHYAVAPQIEPDDLPAIAAAGYRTVVCNRPDGEVPPALQAEAVGAAAAAAGLDFVVNPVPPGQFTAELIQSQAAAMERGPVLAYCASGNRSAIVWCIVKAPELGADGVLAATRAAGYDHAPLRLQLQSIAGV